jgi:hypothetical protein
VPILISESLKNSVGELELDSISNIESVNNAQKVETQELAIKKTPALNSAT